jgi:hypothetical protein
MYRWTNKDSKKWYENLLDKDFDSGKTILDVSKEECADSNENT